MARGHTMKVDLIIQIIQQAQSQALQKSTEGLRSLAHEDDNTDCVLAAAVKGFFSPFISSCSSSRRTSLGTLCYQAPRNFEICNVKATPSTRYLPARSDVCCCRSLRLLQEGDICFCFNYHGSEVSARAVTQTEPPSA